MFNQGMERQSLVYKIILLLVMMSTTLKSVVGRLTECNNTTESYFGSRPVPNGYSTKAETFIDMFTVNCGSDHEKIAGTPDSVSAQLRNIETSGIISLELYLRGFKNNFALDLTPIQKFPDLKHLWIRSQATSRFRKVEIRYSSYGRPLKITQLHLHMRIYRFNYSLNSLLQSMPKLEVLDITDSPDTSDISFINIFQILKQCPMTAISLRMIQSLSLGGNYEPHWNFTKVLNKNYKYSVEYLDMSRNDIQYISGVLYSLPSLKILDLSDNMLHSSSELSKGIHIFEVLFFHQELEVYNLNYQGCHTQISDNRHQNSTVTSSSSQLSQTSLGVKKPILPFSHFTRNGKIILQCINEDVNVIIQNHTVFCTVLNCIIHYNTQTDETIDCKFVPPPFSLLDSDCEYGFRIPFAPKLKQYLWRNYERDVPFSGVHVKDILCFASNDLHHLDLSYNFALSGNQDLYISKIRGWTNLTKLNLEGAGNFNINKSSFTMFPNLQTLFMGNNNITFCNDLQLCSNMPKLRIVDFFSSGITNLPRRMFKACFHLKYLNLANNKIAYLHQSTQYDMDTIANQHELFIDLRGNNLHCHCHSDAQNSIHWIHNSEVTFVQSDTLVCIGHIGVEIIMKKDLENYRKFCSIRDEIMIAVISTASVLIMIFTLVLSVIAIHKYRYRIRTRYYKLKNLIKQLRNQTNISHCYSFDVYLSYCHLDCHFVHCMLLQVLEHSYGIKCCVPDRDFPGSGDHVDLVQRFMQRSRTVIVVLSRASVVSPMSVFERKLARQLEIDTFSNTKVLYVLLNIRGDDDAFVRSLVDSDIGYRWRGDMERSQAEFFARLSAKILKQISKFETMNWNQSLIAQQQELLPLKASGQVSVENNE